MTPADEARIREIVREEIETDYALRACRSQEALNAYLGSLARDRPIIDAMREGRFPTSPGSVATGE